MKYFNNILLVTLVIITNIFLITDKSEGYEISDYEELKIKFDRLQKDLIALEKETNQKFDTTNQKAEIANQRIDSTNNDIERYGLSVGDIVVSMLSEENFQKLHGSNWILADGRNVRSSKFSKITGNDKIPDLRGVFIRGKNNGRKDGRQNTEELELGDFQWDALQNHRHNYADYYAGRYGQSYKFPIKNDSANDDGNHDTERTTGPPIEAKTSSETRGRSVTINYFIRIN